MMIFLIVLAFAWVIFAVVQDFRYREIANWLNFSLIIFALAYRLFYSLFSNNYDFILFGLLGLLVSFVVAHIFYYSRVFAGGDAKLLIALGPVLPISASLYQNALLMIVFLIAFIFSGAVYSLIYSAVLIFANFKDFKKGFKKRFGKYRGYFIVSTVAAILLLVVSFIPGATLLVIPALLVFSLPYLYVSTKVIEEVCMLKWVGVNELTVGDWVEKPIKVGNKIIEPDWEGISQKDLNFLKKNYRGRVLVKGGIPFSPAFLFGLIGFLVYYFWFL